MDDETRAAFAEVLAGLDRIKAKLGEISDCIDGMATKAQLDALTERTAAQFDAFGAAMDAWFARVLRAMRGET